VILTEGALKSTVAFALCGKAIIGMPGPFVTNEAIATLRALGAREALLALDADVRTNPNVARAQLQGLARLKAAGLETGLIRWEPSLGKGLDDALLTARRRKEQS
jgi:DNA primase